MRALLLSLTALAVVAAPSALAQSEADEAVGIDPAPTAASVQHQDLPASARLLTHVIAVLESTNDQILLLDPDSGDLLTASFLTPDPAMRTPVEVCPDPDGQGLLVTDQLADVVFRFSETGVSEGVFAPVGGVNTAILDNVRGCVTDGAVVHVANAGGANADAVATFDATGAYTGNLIANGAGGLDGPWDVLIRTTDILVPSSDSDNILRYDRTGAFLDVFATGAPFTEQISETSTGTILGASFSPSQIDEYSATGAVVGTYTYAGLTGFRGVYELPSGSLIITNGLGVHEVLRDGTIVRTIVSGVSGRYVSLLPGGFVVAGEEAVTPADGAALRVSGANPFRVQTTLTLTVDQTQALQVAAYDVTGRRVATLFDGTLGAGTAHVLTLHGSGLPAGVYAVRATGETFSVTRSVTHVE